MPESIGGAVFEIWTDNVKLERGIQSAREKAKQLSGDFGRLGKKIENSLKGADFERLGKQLTSVGKKLTLGLTAPITAFAALTIKTFGDFDQAMTESTAIMGKLSDEMKNRMTDAAKEIAKQTTFSATEAAESFFFLASAGLSAEQSIAALPRVAKFAQAGAFDMARATDLLTDAQSALGLTVEDTAQNMENMNRVSDVLVKANTLANAKVEEFSEALTNRAGAALRLLNKDLEEGVAVLGVFADQGIKGQRAGEQLSIVLRDLQTASLDNKEAFQAASVTVFDQAGNLRNLADITDDLTRRLAPMTDEQKKAELDP